MADFGDGNRKSKSAFTYIDNLYHLYLCRLSKASKVATDSKAGIFVARKGQQTSPMYTSIKAGALTIVCAF